MGGAADEGVGRVGQGVEHVLADQPALSGLHKRLQQIVDHLGVHGPLGTKNRAVGFSSTCSRTYLFEMLLERYVSSQKHCGHYLKS